jgi:hypothetical protein
VRQRGKRSAHQEFSEAVRTIDLVDPPDDSLIDFNGNHGGESLGPGSPQQSSDRALAVSFPDQSRRGEERSVATPRCTALVVVEALRVCIEGKTHIPDNVVVSISSGLRVRSNT